MEQQNNGLYVLCGAGVQLLVPAGGERCHTVALMLLAAGTYQVTAGGCRFQEASGVAIGLPVRPPVTRPGDEDLPLLQPLYIVVKA